MAAQANRDVSAVDEGLRRRYEQAWQSDAVPVLEEFLPAPNAPGRVTTLIELVCIDIEQRWSRQGHAAGGEAPPPIEDYLRRFSELREPDATIQLIRQELLMRRALGQPASLSEYARRFPDASRLFETEVVDGPGQQPAPGADPANVHPHLPQELGNYELLECIGEGGMGWVYRARHKRLGSLAAVKILKLAISESRDLLSRFHREGRAAAHLRHPSISTAFDAGEQGEWNYIAFEFIEGKNLHQVVGRDGPLPLHVAVAYLRQAAAGLAFAHEQGFVHRDVKPANIMLDRDGNIKVLDLGLACARAHTDWTDVTTADMLMGTVDYMAPEQGLDPRLADAQADIYSLGCTLYFLLTGQRMFSGATYMQRLIAHREQPIPSLRKLRPETPEELERIYAKMVAKKPSDRFASMQEVVAALESLDFSPPATPRAPQTWRWKGAVISVCVMALILAAAWMLRQNGPGLSAPGATKNGNPRDSSIDRQRAGEILALGAAFDATVGGQIITVTKSSQIPEEPFQIVGIELGGGDITDDALIALLPGLKLKSLGLQGCRLTTGGLEEIVRLAPDLESLHFGGIDLSQVDPSALSHLRSLQTIWIGRTQVGDDAIAPLAQIDSLQYLWIGETSVTDAGVRQIAEMPNLHGLGLEYTEVTGDGLQPLAKTQLQTLILDGLPLSDADIEQLAKLKGLQSLSLQDTGLTEDGISRLHTLLAPCEIQK